MWINFKSNLLATLRTSLHFSTELNMSININRGRKTYRHLVNRVIIFDLRVQLEILRHLVNDVLIIFLIFSSIYIKYSSVGFILSFDQSMRRLRSWTALATAPIELG